LFRRRAIFDFKPSQYNGSQHLSFILNTASAKGPAVDENTSFDSGGNIILNSSYALTTQVPMDAEGRGVFDMHEFKLIDDGKRALRITGHIKYWEDKSISDGQGGWVRYNQFQEIETSTGKVLFNWNSISNIHPSASYEPQPDRWAGSVEDNTNLWDYL
jgi:hypothetical protein